MKWDNKECKLGVPRMKKGGYTIELRLHATYLYEELFILS